MGTVTFKNQPGLSKQAVPLEGNSRVYRVANKLWPDDVEEIIRPLLVGETLHVCCGKSMLGDVRLDIDENNNPDIVCDASDMSSFVGDDSFDTVLCDPPYAGALQWNHDVLAELSRIAKSRIVFQHWFIPATKDGRYKKAQDKFCVSNVLVWQPRTYFGRVQVISVFDRLGSEAPRTLDEYFDQVDEQRAGC